jgi:hypothetical protein
MEVLYKHQSETKNKTNKEINEHRAKIDNIKEEGTQDMENLRKKNDRNAKQNGRPIQQNRKIRRHNLRTKRRNGN